MNDIHRCTYTAAAATVVDLVVVVVVLIKIMDIDVPRAVEVFTTLRYANLHLLT